MTALFLEPGPRVFTIPPGAPFAKLLAEGVWERLRAAGLGPEALAEVEVIVSTQRAMRALRSAFVHAGGGASLGPRLRALSDLSGFSELEAAARRPISSGERLLTLARLVRALFQQAPDLGAPVTAPQLAADLAGLLDAAQASGVTLDDLDAIATDDHAAHWALSKQFLDVVRQTWPAMLEGEARIDPAEHNRRAVAALAEHWAETPPERPMIIAGSTGSLDTSAWFIELVSRLPQGAVVLPGLDTAMDAASAKALAGGAAPEHPQTGLMALIERIGVARESVQGWAPDPREDAPARLRLLSQALRPAPVTDAWRDSAEEIAGDAAAATRGLSLIEAPNPRAEAAAIAVAMREALETPGRKAALITPDRSLARRVSAELERWGVKADDSGGRPLSLTPPGVFFSLLAECALSNAGAAPLLALLKHPLTTVGLARGAHARATRRFERRVLRERRPGAGLDAIAAAIDAAGEAVVAEDGAETPSLGPWFARVAGVLGPLMARCAEPEIELDALLAAHVAAAEALTTPAARDDEAPAPEPELYLKAAGETLAGFLSQLQASAHRFGPIAPGEYPALLGQLMSGESVREAFGRHPRALILGPLEARMQSADLVILAGLNEGVWPQIPEPDAWISRDMRRKLGLPALESRIGLSAHDFFQAANAGTAILSRARKAQGAPTVASRWLLRLANLLKGVAPEMLAAMSARGERYVALAELLDPIAPTAPASRPKPTPPLEARPREYSVTEVETLIRDPYAIYARHVLRLRPLPSLDEAPDARDRGELLHAIVERFVRQTREALPESDAARRLFDAIAVEVLAPFAQWPTRHALWLARAARFRDWFLESEADRRATGRVVALESPGAATLETALGEARLKARADRIDLVSGEGYAVYDYKSGGPPTDKQIEQFAQQLPLEAAIAARGGFDGVAKGPVARLAYLRLGGDGETRVVKGDAGEMAEAAMQGLARLLSGYARPDQPYRARIRPQFLAYEGDYDHLARLGEWEDGQ